jgi:hypothetical protein
MEVPIQFPDEAEKIYQEALAFRRLSADEKWAVIMGLLALGESIMKASPNRKAIKLLQQEHEDQWQKAQRELFARHGL